ncbi:GntR family transcriptional regulator [Acuticoccus sediminis]|uniref:GntR family transcriptional regulator n=1 Tax=Acuticoccus sediminis TaxID=2184697 RepID=A0A8B2NIU9_9HYPH|nr:GntR family transcriptional regulator [Acuticoccus sediminis]RAH97441.1 GntR family transcriptional regulator [Acuticoccus sediminis]
MSQTEKTTRATTIYQKLRADIIHGAYAPGAKLRIDGIATKYDVGSNAVREALSRLSSERLVERHEQRGYTVPPVALDDWRILARTRCFLEGNVLQESMRNRDDRWEETIVVAFHRLARVSGADVDTAAMREGWEDAHRNFHRALIANCGSPWLLDFCDILADHAARYISFSNAFRKAPRDGLAEHETLMKTVLHGTPEEASDCLTRHYTRTLEVIEDLFERDELPTGPQTAGPTATIAWLTGKG